MNSLKSYWGLPKGIYIIFLVQVVNRFGDFVVPFLTLFLTVKLGYSIETVGFITMLSALVITPGALFGGKLADHVGRKKTYLFMQTSAALCLVPCAFVNNNEVIVGLLIASTFFNGAVRPSLTAFIADLLPGDERKIGFSLSYLGINVGVALGPIVAGYLFNNHLSWLFIGDAITSFLAIGLVYFNIKETLHMDQEHIEHAEDEKPEEGTVFSVLKKRPQLLCFYMINVLFSFIYTQHRFSLPLMSEHIFGADGAKYFGYMMSVNAFTVLALTAIITVLTKRFKPLSNMMITAVLYGIGFGMLAYIQGFNWFIVSTIIWTIGEVLIVTNFNVYVINKTPANFRARISSVSAISWSVGGALGTWLMGGYIGSMGIRMVWPLTFILSMLSLVGLFVLKLYDRKKEPIDMEDTA